MRAVRVSVRKRMAGRGLLGRSALERAFPRGRIIAADRDAERNLPWAHSAVCSGL
jgi:hypothetical protein